MRRVMAAPSLRPLLDSAALDPAPMAAREIFLAGLAPRAHPVGDLVFLEGDPGGTLFLVVSGEVMVTRRSLAGDPVELARMSAGDFVGEAGLLHGSRRGATGVSTAPDTVVVEVSRSHVEGALVAGNEAARALLRAMTRRLAQRVRVAEGKVRLVRDALAGEDGGRVRARMAELGRVDDGPDAWRRELLPFFAQASG